MFEIGNRTWAHSPEGSADLSLTHVETGVRGATRFGGFEISYLRPTRARIAETGISVPIRDHVMLVRSAMIALVVLCAFWGRRR